MVKKVLTKYKIKKLVAEKSRIKKFKRLSANDVYGISTNNVDTETFMKVAYTEYGKHIAWAGYDNGRFAPDLRDGLRPAYRHALQTMWSSPDRLVSTQTLKGTMIGTIQFTGDQNLQDVFYTLALRFKCLDTQGTVGAFSMTGDDLEGAAPRYTMLKLKKEIREQLDKLMPLVEGNENFTGNIEKAYIPTPIPLGLIGGFKDGMLIGAKNTMPSFTADSLLNAYLKNDPSLLKLNFGYTLGDVYLKNAIWDNETDIPNIDIAEVQKPTEENKEQLNEFWKTGHAKFNIGIPVYNCTINGISGYMLVCEPAIIKPKQSKKIQEWIDKGYIEWFDYSAGNYGKIFIYKIPKTKKITDKELLNEITRLQSKISSQPQTYNCAVAVPKGSDYLTGCVPIGQWLDYTYNNYSKLYQKYLDKELDQLDFMEAVWRNFEFCADKLIKYDKDEMSDEEIIQACNEDSKQKKLQIGENRYGKKMVYKCTLDVLKYIASKPIGTLRQGINLEDRLDKVFEQRDYFINVSIPNEITKFCNTWSDLKGISMGKKIKKIRK